MSTTTTKLPLTEALAQAEAFKAMFRNTWSRWEIAGSIRRRKSEVGDIEHVVMAVPTVGPNRVWSRLEELTTDPTSVFPQADKPFTRAIYADGRNRWGPRYRGVEWKGIRHELFLAVADNWGSILAIRTGPAANAPRIMDHLNKRGYRHFEGVIIDRNTGVRIAVPDEQTFFELCGEPYRVPEDRK